SSCKSSVAETLICSTTCSRVAFEKPGLVTVKTYSPGIIWRNWYAPLLSVTPCREAPVVSLFSDTTAPGITAPWGSETTPCKELVDCALVRATAASRPAPSKRLRQELRRKVLVNMYFSSD